MATSDPPLQTLANVAGNAYAALIADQLTQARALKASLEARGVAVITSSGVLVTLLLAFVGLTKAVKSIGGGGQAADVPLSWPTRLLLILAAVLFLIAVVLALRMNNARQYDEVTAKGFIQLLDQKAWSEPDAVIGALRAAEAQRNILLEFRARNTDKALELNTALGLEVAALVSLTAAVVSILLVG